MTISTTNSVVSYIGDGTANPLPVPYPFLGTDELEVIETVNATGVDTTKALGGDYTVAGGNDDVGTVTPTSARPATVTWTIRRVTRQTQPIDYVPNDDFPADTHELALDRLTMIVQEFGEQLSRAIEFPKSEAGTNNLLPSKVQRALQWLGFDAAGNFVVGSPAASGVPISAAMQPVVAAASIAAALALLGVTPVGGAGQAPTSGGSANAQTLTYNPAVTAYATGLPLNFVVGLTNTGPATMNVNGLGAKNIFAEGRALSGGELVAGNLASMVYDGVQLQLVSQQPLSDMPVALRNILINGGAEVWQRGAGGSASIAVAASTTSYCEDRSYIITGANQAHTVSQQAGLTNGSRFCARVQRNSGQTGTGAMLKAFPLTTDQVVAMRGSIVTFKAKVRSGANWSPASGALALTLYVGTGAEGKRGAGFTGETTVASASANLGTSSAVTDLVAVSGAVVPTNATQGELRFSWTPVGTAGANDYFEHDDLQLELGGLPTAFERRPFDVELAQCQRFFQKSFPYATAPAQNVGNQTGCTQLSCQQTGPINSAQDILYRGGRQRATPTITTFNPNAANANWRDTGNSADRTAAVVQTSDTNVVISAASMVAGSIYIHWTADAEL